jgi:hypothetical protein
MSSKAGASEFLSKTSKDPKLGARVLKVFAKHGKATAADIRKVAREAGYSFSQRDFEKAVKKDMSARFSAGKGPTATAAKRRKRLPIKSAPESACSRGCLSYTHNWHP